MPWNAQNLSELAASYWQSGALNAAMELGIFDALGSDARDAASLASELSCDAQRLRSLLDALVGLSLLEQNGETYRIDSSARALLVSSGPQSMSGALRFNRDLYPLWGKLADVVRNGEPAMPASAHLGADREQTRRFVHGMHSRAMAFAGRLVRGMDVTVSRNLLDVGAGAGTISAMLLQAHPMLHATLLDLPPVLEVARELLSESHLDARLSFHPADYREDPLPSGFDTILYCGALHQENEASARDLFGRMAEAVQPGGSLLVIDLMTDASRARPAFSALFSLTMHLLSPLGSVFSIPQTQALLNEVGLRASNATELVGTPYTLIRATRPA